MNGKEGVIMGDLYLELTVANLSNLEQHKDVSFLVDTGSTRTWLPKQIVKELGIEPMGEIELELADGTVKEFPYGSCYFDFGGERIAGNVVIGKENSEPIVGTHILQEFRLVIDLERHTISRKRAMKAK